MAGYPFLRPPRQPDDLGELGGYRILQLLGDGAMGFVFLAQEKTLDRRLALKVMRPEYSATPEGRERFLREARASAKVESDHVVTIYQVGEDNGTPFIAMELLEGMSLQTWLAKRESLPSISSVFKVARDLFPGTGRCPCPGIGPPRYQAIESLDRETNRADQDFRFWTHQGRRWRRQCHPKRSHSRHASLHGPRAGQRPTG